MKPVLRLSVLSLVVLLVSACSKPNDTYRPMGYLRIDLPDTAYHHYHSDRIPVSFDLSDHAMPTYHDSISGGLTLVYPELKARVYCDYKAVQSNLRQLSEDAYDFVQKHNVKAYGISALPCGSPDRQVYGLFYYLRGREVASPIQFVLTDSTNHFFRGALYFDMHVNQDSLSPVIDYLGDDIMRMIDSFEWQ